MSEAKSRYLVVEGPIGVGKTSLVQRLSRTFGGEPLLERAEENPFLERFYRDPKAAALPTQLSFLFQRARQLQALRQGDIFTPLRVADFMLEKDRLFAQLNLDDDELGLYEQVYQHLSLDAPAPDLVVYLQAPIEVLIQRVAKRGIGYEQFIQRDYLARIADAYSRFFHHYQRSPLLIVNAADINPVDSEEDYQMLVREISRVKSGRHYFNPGRVQA
ncbi:MAG TPA: deoxynucleoside kinase [Gammaproteobacteria bacterium]|nr:deoxynucleoside kinase [Gammaproteobacteria bacterium]